MFLIKTADKRKTASEIRSLFPPPFKLLNLRDFVFTFIPLTRKFTKKYKRNKEN